MLKYLAIAVAMMFAVPVLANDKIEVSPGVFVSKPKVKPPVSVKVTKEQDLQSIYSRTKRLAQAELDRMGVSLQPVDDREVLSDNGARAIDVMARAGVLEGATSAEYIQLTRAIRDRRAREAAQQERDRLTLEAKFAAGWRDIEALESRLELVKIAQVHGLSARYLRVAAQVAKANRVMRMHRHGQQAVRDKAQHQIDMDRAANLIKILNLPEVKAAP